MAWLPEIAHRLNLLGDEISSHHRFEGTIALREALLSDRPQRANAQAAKLNEYLIRAVAAAAADRALVSSHICAEEGDEVIINLK